FLNIYGANGKRYQSFKSFEKLLCPVRRISCPGKHIKGRISRIPLPKETRRMAYQNTKAAKLAIIPKLLECLESGQESKIEECFHQDFKMLVPGCGGTRESNDLPIPPGIAGNSPTIFVHRTDLKDQRRSLARCIR